MEKEIKLLDQLNVLSNESNHKVFVYHRFKDRIELYERSYDVFLHSINESKIKFDEQKDRSFHEAYLRLCMKINCDIRTVYHAIVNGWYGTAEGLFRELYDAIIKIIYIANFSKDAQKTLQGKLKTEKIRSILKNKSIQTPLSDKGWGKLSQMKHAEFGQDWAYGDLYNSEILLRYYPNINASYINDLFVYASGLLIYTSSSYRDFHISKYGENFYIPTFLKSLSILEKRIMELFKAEAKES